jgi:hypothetical protein
MKKKLENINIIFTKIQGLSKLFSVRVFVLLIIMLIMWGNLELLAQKQWIVNPGDNYRAILPQLQPGDELILHEGIYEGNATIRKSGTTDKPIIIRGFGNGEERPVLLLNSASSNLYQVYASNLIFDFLEFQSKYSYAVRIGATGEGSSFNNITIKNCVFYKSGGGDISANANVGYNNIKILDNYFIGPKQTPVYIGQHDGLANVTNFLFKGNVIDGSQIYGDNIVGYGIQFKLNVTASIIENNYITNTKGPGIMVYGAQKPDTIYANIVRNNILVGSREEAGIVAGGGPSTLIKNLTLGCNGGISVQNYNNRNLIHNMIVNSNTSACDLGFGMSFGNVQNITAQDNLVITKDSLNAYVQNPNPGINNKFVNASEELKKVVKEELINFIPARNNLEKIWQQLDSVPLTEADVLEIIDLILEYKIPLGGERYPVSSPLLNSSALKVTMYPNPTDDKVNIEFKNSFAEQVEVCVYTLTGKLALRKNFNDIKHISFSMKDYVSGIYFVKLNLEGKEIVKKLVLNKK